MWLNRVPASGLSARPVRRPRPAPARGPVRPRPRPPDRRGPRPRRTRASTRPDRRPGLRRPITVSPGFPRTGTRRWSTTLAVTRSRTSCSRRAGSVDGERVRRLRFAVLSDLGDAEPSRRPASQAASSTVLPRDLHGGRVLAPDHHQVQPGAEQPGAVVRDGVGQDLLAARQVGAREHLGGDSPATVDGTSLALQCPFAQAAAVLLEGDQLAEHAVVLRRAARPGWCAAAATSGRRCDAWRSAHAAGGRAGST